MKLSNWAWGLLAIALVFWLIVALFGAYRPTLLPVDINPTVLRELPGWLQIPQQWGNLAFVVLGLVLLLRFSRQNPGLVLLSRIAVLYFEGRYLGWRIAATLNLATPQGVVVSTLFLAVEVVWLVSFAVYILLTTDGRTKRTHPQHP